MKSTVPVLGKHWVRFIAMLATLTTLLAACIGSPSLANALEESENRPHVSQEIQDANGDVVAFVRLKALSGIENKIRTKSLLDMQYSGLSETAKEEKANQAGRASAAASRQVLDSTFSRLQNLDPEALKFYDTSSVITGVAVKAEASALRKLAQQFPEVASVEPIARMVPDESKIVPAQSAPSRVNTNVAYIRAVDVWSKTGYTGKGNNIAIIDTGLDYTHADFGGRGDVDAYNLAFASTADPLKDPSLTSLLDPNKYKGGYDFAGAKYDADQGIQPVPDDNPIDYQAGRGHGTHVSGIAAGYGVKADFSTFRDDYKRITTNDLRKMVVPPGVAPEAGIYALKVFGDDGGTTILAPQALDWVGKHNLSAAPEDRISVVSMSLGSPFGQIDCTEEAFITNLLKTKCLLWFQQAINTTTLILLQVQVLPKLMYRLRRV